MPKKKIGFIGQGWIGKNYADDFENRGFKVVRYSDEPAYSMNKDLIATCDIVFIAVPAPTTPDGFDASILKKVIKLVGKGKTAVIKCTTPPGTTEKIQKANPNIIVLHSPEFLTTGRAASDSQHPARNILGCPVNSKKYKDKAKEVMAVLPASDFSLICSSRESELIKYASNCFYYLKTVYANIFYDFSAKFGADWKNISSAMAADPMIGHPEHLQPVHKKGRGAGGGCLIKDFAMFSQMYKGKVNDVLGWELLDSARDKNFQLLLSTGKDIEILKGVYGDKIIDALLKRKK